MRYSDLRQKEVINCRDCKKLGYITDLDISADHNKICGIIIPVPGKIFSCFGNGDEYYISMQHIVKIGPDIILVDVVPDEICVRKK